MLVLRYRLTYLFEKISKSFFEVKKHTQNLGEVGSIISHKRSLYECLKTIVLTIHIYYLSFRKKFKSKRICLKYHLFLLQEKRTNKTY